MNMDTSIITGDAGAEKLGNMVSTATDDMRMWRIKQALRTAPNEDVGLARVKQIDPMIGMKLEQEKQERAEAKQEYEIKQAEFQQKHQNGMFEAAKARMSPIAGMMEDLDFGAQPDGTPNDPSIVAKWPWIKSAADELGIAIPSKPDANFVKMFIARAKGLEGRLNEMKVAKVGATKESVFAEKLREGQEIEGMPEGPEKEKRKEIYLRSLSYPTQYATSPESVEQAGRKAAAVAAAKAPVDINVAQKKADIAFEQKRKEASMQEVSGQQLKKEDISLMSSTIAEIESNPTVLEKLPAGYVDIARNAGKFGLTPESATMYANNLQRISDVAALMARSKLKGQGQVSNFEGEMLASAATNIKTGTPTQRKTELARIKDMTEKMAYRIENGIFTKNGKWYKFVGTNEVEVPSSEANQKAGYSSQNEHPDVIQNGVTYKWNGTKYE